VFRYHKREISNKRTMIREKLMINRSKTFVVSPFVVLIYIYSPLYGSDLTSHDEVFTSTDESSAAAAAVDADG